MKLDELVPLLVNHPRMRAALASLVRNEATRIHLEQGAPAGAPAQAVTYAQAATLLGLKVQTVRTYVMNGKLKGGAGYVNIDSVLILKARLRK